MGIGVRGKTTPAAADKVDPTTADHTTHEHASPSSVFFSESQILVCTGAERVWLYFLPPLLLSAGASLHFSVGVECISPWITQSIGTTAVQQVLFVGHLYEYACITLQARKFV